MNISAPFSLKGQGGGYLPVGVCSKNDKGACINEFNIFAKSERPTAQAVGLVDSRHRAVVSSSSTHTSTLKRA